MINGAYYPPSPSRHCQWAPTWISGGKDPEIRQNLVLSAHNNTNTIVHREQLVIVGNLLANCLYLRRLVLRRARNLVVIAYLIV